MLYKKTPLARTQVGDVPVPSLSALNAGAPLEWRGEGPPPPGGPPVPAVSSWVESTVSCRWRTSNRMALNSDSIYSKMMK